MTQPPSTNKTKDPESEAKAAEKDTKKVFESYYEVAKHRLGRPPTPDEVLKIMTEEHSVNKSEFPMPESVPMPGQQQEAVVDKGPAILHMKVYYGKKDGQPDPHEILFYEHPQGMVYDVSSEEWLPSRPNVVNHLMSRPMGFDEKDIVSAILHGVMSDSDYDALDSRSMISENPQKLWNLTKKLKTQLEELEQAKSIDETDQLSKSDDSFEENDEKEQELIENNLQSDEYSQNVDFGSDKSELSAGEDLVKRIISEAMSPGVLGPYIEKAVRRVVGGGEKKNDTSDEKSID